MSAVDQHAEAHRLKDELGYGARRIGKELGITRHAATQLLDRPLPQPVAEAAEVTRKPAVPVADRVAGHLAVMVGHRPETQPLDDADRSQDSEVADQTEATDQPAAALPALPRRVAEPLAGIDASQWPALRRDLAVLAQCGRSAEALVHQAVVALAYGYRQALARGDLEPGQPFIAVDMTLRPLPVPASRGA
ncbi:hypothetical protein [Streptomyces sp. CoT10]|uniref:hypothetical protein n=1 Tax=Streptomyces sp. CoT10 TaxID=2875762 RepID=UPI001CD56FCC|nr:hypothetical protein [Streptomyces sp. CoT10]